MKILFVANRIPYPPYRGDKLKIYNLAKELRNEGHELHLATFISHSSEYQYKEVLEEIFESVSLTKQPKWKSLINCLLGVFTEVPFQVLYFRNKRFKKSLKTVIESVNPEAIHVQHLRMAQYFNSLPHGPKVILDLPDAFSLYWHRRMDKAKGFAKKLFTQIEYKRLLKYEKRMFTFHLNLACSKEDINYLKAKHEVKDIALLSNGVDIDTFKPLGDEFLVKHRVLFTGNMDYAPNIDGATYFVEEILPLVEKEVPEVEFVIAGQRPVRKVLDLARKNVSVTGFIPKLNEMYATAQVVVSPLRIGAGTQNKVLESMSMGVPVVCTNIGFEGLDAKNGEGVFCEVETNKFAQRVIDILKNPKDRDELGKKAASHIRNRFSWNQIAKQLSEYLAW